MQGTYKGMRLKCKVDDKNCGCYKDGYCIGEPGMCSEQEIGDEIEWEE